MFKAHHLAVYNPMAQSASQQGRHHSLTFSPHQQMQQASGSTQPVSSSEQQLSGSGVNSSAAEGSSDQLDAAPKAGQRVKKQQAAAAQGPAVKRSRGKKGKEGAAEVVDLSEEAEGSSKQRASDWTVPETVWVSVSLMLCLHWICIVHNSTFAMCLTKLVCCSSL